MLFHLCPAVFREAPPAGRAGTQDCHGGPNQRLKGASKSPGGRCAEAPSLHIHENHFGIKKNTVFKLIYK